MSVLKSIHILLDTPATERKRSLSMQSYTLEHPSEALLNSTLNENKNPLVDNTSTTNNSRSAAVDTSPAVNRSPNNLTTEPYLSRKTPDPLPKINQTHSVKYKTKIPTLTTAHTLLSKCQLDTPPSPEEYGNVRVGSRTPLASIRHRQLHKVVNPEMSMEYRSLTPAPPSRVLTPTPPNRPQSEIGTRSSRSRLDRKANRIVKGIDCVCVRRNY